MNVQTVVSDGHTPDRGPTVFAVTTATLVLSSIFVIARVICRYFIVRKMSWDDKVMILAWLIAFFLSLTINLGTANGLGRHDADIPHDQWPRLRRCEYVFSILYNPALMATKTSIILFLLRLFKNTQIVLKYASYFLLGMVNIAGIILTFMNIFQCKPIQAAWNPYYEGKITCIPLLTEFICASPVNIISNLALLALPIPVLTGLKLPLRQKSILVLTFMLSIFVTVVDVIRIKYLQEAITDVPTGATTDPASRFGGQMDFSWNASTSFMWSAVEVNIGITCACIPTLKPLILKLLPAMLYDPDGSGIMQSSKGSDLVSAQHRQTSNDVSVPQTAVLPPDNELSPEPSRETPLSAMEFLTTPGEGINPNFRPRVSTTATTENAVYFGFVNMAKPKSMIKTSAAESFRYCTVVSVLFLLWGISYGLLNTLNQVVSNISSMSPAQTLGLTSIYFGAGYFVGPVLVGEWILRRDEHNRSKRHERNQEESIGGFKVCFMVGLCIYGVGTIIFWPSAVTGSWGGFMLSNFITGVGLSTLEVGANAFLILCGPPEHGETRLLLAQGVQGIGSVISGVLANHVFFTGVDDNGRNNSRTLVNVQWTYLAITLLCVALALFFYYMPLPEVSDAELEASAERSPVDTKKKTIFGLELRTVSLVLAVFTQYLYTAAQECNSIYFRDLLLSVVPGNAMSGGDATEGANQSNGEDHPPDATVSIPNYLLIGHTAFAVSRFMVGGLTYLSVRHPRLPRPRTYLSIFMFLSFLFALLIVVLRPTRPDLIVIPVILFFFAEGPLWPLIFTIGLRGQGRRTKRAAAFITMGASGASWPPYVMFGIINNGGTVQTAFIVIVAFQVTMWVYPVFLEGFRDARLMVDPRPRAPHELSDEETTTDEILANRLTNFESASEKPRGLFDKFSKGLGTTFGSGRRKSSPLPQVHHDETS